MPKRNSGALEALLPQILSQTWIDWSITATALAYVFLAARERPSCWYWGIVSCGLWAWADFFRYNLWVDGTLQLFYVGMGIWGLYSWKYSAGDNKPLPIQRLSGMVHFRLILMGVLLTLLLGFVFDRYTPTALPYPDSFITAFSIIATFLTVRKVLESWLYWVVVDLLAVFLFHARGALLVSAVMFLYSVIAVYGLSTWRVKFAGRKP